MTVNSLASLINAKSINLSEPDRKITSGYAGDFLSFVMGKAPADCVWFTVMNNVNVCAVATLAEVSAVVLCEGVQPDENLLNKVKAQNVNLLVTDLDIYSAAVRASGELK